MKRQRNFLIIILLSGFCLQPVLSQTIRFELPEQKGKTLYLLASMGVRRDTLFSGAIDENGVIVFTPSRDKPLKAGVVSFVIKPDVSIDFIYSPEENATLHCDGQYVYAQNIKFENSPENEFVNTRFAEQVQRNEKIMFCEQGMRLYRENESLINFLKGEKDSLDRQQADFETMLQDEAPKFYSASLLQLHNLMNDYISRIQVTPDITELANIKEYALSHINTDALYRSGIWFSVINGMLDFYYKDAPFYGQFGNDIATLLQKTQSQEVFLALADNAATICSQFAWNTDEAALSKYLLLSGRVTNPQGKLKQMLMVNKLQPGMPAPKIAGTNDKTINFAKDKKTLVVFYESDCSNCATVMKQLVDNYSMLKDKKIDIVSIASDLDMTGFENAARNHPWTTKICDLKGFEGDNFKNYAIIGTPTIYLIDEKGIIQGKYAGWDEITNSLFQPALEKSKLK